LAEQGFTFESVVPAGREVVLSRIAHSWAGAGVTDVTDEVHPRVAAQCVRAARMIGLDVAGLDIVAEDIARPLEDQGGAILEVNAEPTIAFHFPPLCDSHRPVCEAIIDSLFPDGGTGRIPLAAVSGLGERAGVGRSLARLLRASNRETGWASSEGLFLGVDLLKPGDQANLAGNLAALLLPEVEVAVLERELSGICNEGLGVDRLDVLVLTDLGAGLDAEQTRAAGVLLGAVGPAGAVVVDANDHAAITLVEAFPGTLILVGGDGVARGGRAAAFLRDDHLVLRARDGGEKALPLGESVMGSEGVVQGWLLALAAAFAMGVPAETLGALLPSLLRGR
jgi:cyanophycin synthetase